MIDNQINTLKMNRDLNRANSLILRGRFLKTLIHLKIVTLLLVNKVIIIFIDVMSILFSDLNMLKLTINGQGI